MRMLGLSIHHGYSPEARVFASLLGNRQNAYEATVFYQCWRDHPQGVDNFEADSNACILRVDTGWRPNPENNRSAIEKVRSIAHFYSKLPSLLRSARAYNPDVLYSCQQTWDCVAATYLAQKLGKPQIMHLHYTLETNYVANRFQRQAMERLRTCAHVVAISDFIRDCAIQFGVPAERVTTIWNTMHPLPASPAGTREAVRAEFGIPVGAPLIGIIARLEPWKGQADTIRAFAQLASCHPEARLLVVGDGAYRQELEQMANATGYGERIVFTGRRSDVPRLLAALDIFAHPSRFEPAGLSVLEASAAGLPVVAYAEGGIQESVLSGETGVLTPPEDIGALSNALDRLLRSPTDRKEMGSKGRERIETMFRPADAGLAFSKLLKQVASSQ